MRSNADGLRSESGSTCSSELRFLFLELAWYNSSMATSNPISATEILDEIVEPIEPAFAGDFARMLLRLRMSDEAQQRIRELLQQNNAGTLEIAEKAALENYLLVGQFVDLLQAKARASLQNGAGQP